MQTAPKIVSAANARNDKQSAWNTAGTWEDKDKTSWAKKKLKQLIEDIVLIDDDGSSCQVTKLEKIEGDASIISARGKTRYVYDFGFEMKFTVIHAPSGDVNGEKEDGNDDEKKKQEKIKGTLVFRDLCNDADLDDEGVRGILQSLRKPPKDDNVKNAIMTWLESCERRYKRPF